jgi:hypothetical protein
MYDALTLDRGYAAPDSPEGVYRMWLFRTEGAGDGGPALVVLTELPFDRGPGLMARLASILPEVASDHRLAAATTRWYVRRVAGPGSGPDRESFGSIDPTAPHAAALPCSRAAVERITACALPPISGDEFPRGADRS